MTIFRYRYLALAACTFIFGLWAFFRSEQYGLIANCAALLFAIFAVTAVFILITKKARQALSGLVLLSFSFLFLFINCSLLYTQRIAPAQELRGKSRIMEARVEDITQSDNLYLELSNKTRVFCRYAEDCKTIGDPKPNDTLLIELNFDPVPFDDYDFTFDAKSFFNSKGYYISASIPRLEVIASSSPSLIEQIRGFFGSLLNKMNYSSLASAIFMGDNASEEMTQTLKLGGASHLLAVSGLHVSVIMFSAHSFLERIKLKLKPRTVILSIFALLYLILLDFSPSVTRAVIMSCISLWALPLRKNSDSLTNLFVAMALILLFDPQAATDPSAILSFTASFGIIKLSAPIIAKLEQSRFMIPKSMHGAIIKGVLKWLLDSLAVTLGAVIFTLPIMLGLSKNIAVISPLANVFLVTFFSPLLCCVFIYICIGSLLYLLGAGSLVGILAKGCDLVFFLFEKLSAIFSNLIPLLKLSLHQYTAMTLSVLAALLALVGLFRIKLKYLIALCLIIPICFFASDLAFASSTKAKVVCLWDKSDQYLSISSKGENYLFAAKLSKNDQKLTELLNGCNLDSFDTLVLLAPASTDALYKLLSDVSFERVIALDDDGSCKLLAEELNIPFKNAQARSNTAVTSNLRFKAVRYGSGIAADIFINGSCISYRYNFKDTPISFTCSESLTPQLVLLSQSPKMYYEDNDQTLFVTTSTDNPLADEICTKEAFMVYIYENDCAYIS